MAARGFYGRWAQMLSGASWDELAVTPPLAPTSATGVAPR